jgi:hypothetical protein
MTDNCAGYLIWLTTRRKMMPRSILLLLIVLLIAPLALVSAQDGQPITIGELVSGQISDEKPVDTYTFAGTAGQMITITMTAVDGNLDSYLTVIAPDGSESSNDDSNGTFHSTLPLVLPVDGTYTIRAMRCCGEASQAASEGSYELVVNTMSIQTFTVGSTVTVEITPEQQVAYVALAAQVGQILRLDAVTLEGDALFVIEIRNPAGTMMSSFSQMPGMPAVMDPIFVNQDGQYMLTVILQNPQGVNDAERVSLAITADEVVPQPIAIGDTLTGTLDDGNPVAYYSFEASSSDLLRVEGSRPEGSGEFEVVLFSASGMPFSSNGTGYNMAPGSFVIDPLQMQESGSVLLLVRRTILGDPQQAVSSSYSITLGMTGTPILQSGSPVEGSFSQGIFEYVYRFEGTAGQNVRLTLRSVTDDYAPMLNMQSPQVASVDSMMAMPPNFYLQISGSSAASATYEFTLPDDGTYLLRVGNSIFSPDGTTSGTFMLMLEVLP